MTPLRVLYFSKPHGRPVRSRWQVDPAARRLRRPACSPSEGRQVSAQHTHKESAQDGRRRQTWGPLMGKPRYEEGQAG